MKKPLAALVSASMIVSPLAVAPVWAATPSGLGDLIGARGSSAESELTARGYKLATSKGAANMWWSHDDRTCVSVLVDNGRVDSIQSASASDCGKSGGNDAATAAIVGAAAIGLAAALSSHHKNSNQRNNNPAYNSEYQRGYNDAMYGGHYATNDSEAYHSGFMAGEAERNNRRHANSSVARSLPGTAGNACIHKGETEWGVYPGSVSVVSSSAYAPGNWEVVLATGHWRAWCKVTANGQVKSFKAN